MSEPAVRQLWLSVFGHSEWKHLVRFVMADEDDVSVKIRQRYVIEFCVKLGKSGNKTLELLRQAYGGETLSHAAVFHWWRHFKDGNTRVIDKARARTCFVDHSCVLAGHPLRLRMSILPRLRSCRKMTEG